MKNNKQFIKYFIVVAIMFITLLPMTNFYHYAIKYDYKNFFNTDKFEQYINYAVYNIFNISLEPSNVVAGKDGFLFLGNKHSNIIHHTNGTYDITEEMAIDWVKRLKELQHSIESRGVKFVFVIAPNKHTIYNEKLPNWIKYKRSLTNRVVSNAKKESINILDLRDDLNKYKNRDKDKLLYNKVGTHWNSYGASIGYESTINFLNNNYNISLMKPNYRIDNNFKGKDKGLIYFLKIQDYYINYPENEYKYVFHSENIVCHGNIDKPTKKLGQCIMKKNPIVNINRHAQYIINHSSTNKKKLLWLCDSYADANSRIYNATFEYIWKFYHSHLHGKALSGFIDKNKPDVIIYQIVERGFYDKHLVNSLK